MECTFCFICLEGLRGRKSQFSGDAVKDGVVRGRERGSNNNNDRELHSIRILMNYLLNTANDKHASVLKGVLQLAGVSSAADHGGDVGDKEGLQKFPRKCFRLCEKCEGIAETILELHLELEKVQMKIVQEVKTVRESIQKSSGWLGGTGQGMVNESEDAFENFSRRFFHGDLTTEARGTFGFLKTFQTAVANIDKTAMLVPLVYLERCAITQNFDLSVPTGSLKTEPNDEDDAIEPFHEDAVHSISFDPQSPDPAYSLIDDNYDSDFNVDEEDIPKSTRAHSTTAQGPEDIPSWILTRITIKREKGTPLGGKNIKRANLPPVVKQEPSGDLLGTSELVVVGGSGNIGMSSWNPAEDDSNLHDEDTGLHQLDVEIGSSVSFDKNLDSNSNSHVPVQTIENREGGPSGKKKPKTRGERWYHLKNRGDAYRLRRKIQLAQQPYQKPTPRPTKKSQVSTEISKTYTPRSPSEFYPDFDPDEDIDPEEDVKDSDYTPEEERIYPYKKKPKTHSKRLVQSAKRRRGRPPMLQNLPPSKNKSPSKKLEESGETRKPGRPVIGEGPNPVPRVGQAKKFACESCSFINRDIYRMEQHLRGHETEEKVFKCEPCNMGFSNEQHYRLHEGRHRGHNRVRCEVDGCHNYISVFEIADHLKSHAGVEQIFPCSYCTHFLPSVGMHLAHLRKYHTSASVEWKCLICGEIFKKVPELVDHLQEAHPDLDKINCSYQDCDRTFSDPESLRIHNNIHRMKFGCTQCDRSFSTQAFLDLHQEFHRTGKPYKCDLGNCSEAFPDQAGLRKHKVEIHQFEKQVCEVCGKEFRNIHNLKTHRITSHGLGGGRPCPVCNRLFPSAQPLSRHMAQAHSTTRDYICEDCGKAFKTMNKCNNHRQIHGEPTYRCPHCPKAFRQRPALNDHIRIHTGEKPFLCRKCGKGFRQGGTRNKHEKVCLHSSLSQKKSGEKMEAEEPGPSKAVELKRDVTLKALLAKSSSS